MEQLASPTSDTHLVALGTTGWSLWTDVALRSAGFAAAELESVCDTELAAAADRAARSPADTERYREVFDAATERLTAAVRRIASDPRFREAVAWQNPALMGTCLDKAVRGEPRNVRGRNHELTIVSYLQRYTQKNDTVGFFGPVGWAGADPSVADFSARPGPALLRRRTTYFEVWAIDALASRIAAEDGIGPWLVPKPDASRASGHLSAADSALLKLCDGVRTVREVVSRARADQPAGDFADERLAVAALLRLRELGALRIDLLGPMHAWPERVLWQRLERVGDATVRAAALAPLRELVEARDAIDRACGDADKVLSAMDELGETFTRLSGTAASRRHGRSYAGRTLVYQDTVRDVEIQLGRQVLDTLAPPLGLVLDSARWLTNLVAQRYHDLFLRIHARQTRSRDDEPVRLAQLLMIATGQLGSPESRVLPPLVAEAVTEFQHRWQRLLGVPAGVRSHHVEVAAVADLAAQLFPPGPVRWANARQHSPDIMIAARDQQAIRRGDFQLVLGEIHLSTNTLESRLFVEQHDDPGRLLAAAEADADGRRVYAVQRKSSPFVTSRVSPPTALLSPEFSYWTIGDESVDCPVDPLSAAELDVYSERERLVVRSRRDGREFDFLEVIGEILSSIVVDAFRPMPQAAHQPRISLDRLVLCRESWNMATTGAGWAFLTDERTRYAAARAWMACLGMPERCFVKVPVENKPSLVDFTSLALVNLLAKAIRRTAEAGQDSVTITECLPGPGSLWLNDIEDYRYTSELRMVAVDRPRRPT